MNKTILNQEHVEARQAEIDKLNKAYKEKLSVEDRAKYEAVEAAIVGLESKGIMVYLYAWLPSLVKPEQECMVQYNNMSTVIGFDEKGKFKEDVGEINDSLLASVWNTFGQAHNGSFDDWCLLQYGAILREQKRLGLVKERKDEDV